MMKYIWAGILICSTIIGILTGGIREVSDAAMAGAKDAAALAVSMIGTYALWLGILNILEKSGAVRAIARRSERVVLRLFKGLKKGAATAYITMNLVANMLGMGSAATPFGLKAMEELKKQSTCGETASHEMCLFLIINTASVQLLPLSIIAVRAAAGSAAPAEIVVPSFLATLGTAVFSIILAKLCAAGSRR